MDTQADLDRTLAPRPRGNSLEPVAGELEAPVTCQEHLAKQGDKIVTRGGATGIFVGRTKTGHEWICYDPEDFDLMCSDFEDLVNS